MFSIGDCLFHETGGVCRVRNVCESPLDFMEKGVLYYVLAPISDPNTVLYVPVEGNMILLRPLIDRKDAELLYRDVPNISAIDYEGARDLRVKYEDAMKYHEPHEWVRVVKTFLLRKRAVVLEKKNLKLSETERNCGEKAMRFLCDELSVALDRGSEELENEFKKSFV